jgi:cupin fold WbuC family metalloprotein
VTEVDGTKVDPIGHSVGSAFRLTTPSVLETSDDPVVVGDKEIAAVIAAARKAPNGRSRLILHTNAADNLHEMVIAIPPTSCDHPHINFKSGKSFLALSGQFAVIRFSDDGTKIDPVVLSAGKFRGARMARLRAAAWHTIIPLAGETAFLETITGPFEGNQWAPWFPGENDPGGREQFATRLRQIARDAAAQL